MTARIKDVSRRTVVKTAIAGTALIAAPWVRRVDAAEVLYVNTWGGAWEASTKKHIFSAFTKDTGVEIRTISPVSVAKLAAQVNTGAYEFDVTTLGGGDIVRANKAGIIDTISDANAKDMGCGGRRVPERRCLACLRHRDRLSQRQIPQWRADQLGGVLGHQEVSRTAQPAEIRRAHPAHRAAGRRRADRQTLSARCRTRLQVAGAHQAVDPRVVDARPQSQQLLRDSEVHVIGIWNGRIQELMDQGAATELVWNQAEIDRAYWVVAKGTPRAELARKYIKTAVSPEALAGFCEDANYGPLNPEAFKKFRKRTRSRCRPIRRTTSWRSSRTCSMPASISTR